MQLKDALDRIGDFSDDDVIFARKPWTLDAESHVGSLDADLRVPESMKSLGLEYFLDISVAKEALEVFGDRKPTQEQARDLLLYYAQHDAYPLWVYR